MKRSLSRLRILRERSVPDPAEGRSIVPSEPERDPAVPVEAPEGRGAWDLEAGAEIAPGRTVLKALGGGRRYEVWAAGAQGATQDEPQAVLAKEGGGDDESDEDDEPDTTGNNDTGTGRETAAANTDRAGLNTGVSTRGETDPGDDTGQTERR